MACRHNLYCAASKHKACVAVALMTFTLLAASALALHLPRLVPAPQFSRLSTPRCAEIPVPDDLGPVVDVAAKVDPEFTRLATLDAAIDDLLAHGSGESLLPALGRRLDLLLDGRLIERLDERVAASAEPAPLAELREVSLAFLEEVASHVQELDPELAAAEQAAEKAAADASAAASAAASAGDLGVAAAAGAAVARFDPSAAPPPEPEPAAATPPNSAEARARYRFRLEQLLDAAKAGVAPLDTALREMRDELDGGFFAHLQWEVDQQVAAKNRKVLEILELVVQRACLEVERAEPELQLLGQLLQVQSTEVRREMYETRLKPLGVDAQRRFAAALSGTEGELEKAQLRGDAVDATLLRQIRTIGAECKECAPAVGDVLVELGGEQLGGGGVGGDAGGEFSP